MKKHSPFLLCAYVAGVAVGLFLAMLTAAVTVALPFVVGPQAYMLNLVLGVILGYPFGVIAGVGTTAQAMKQSGSWWMLVTSVFALSLLLIIIISRLATIVDWPWLWALYLLALPWLAAVAYRGRWQKMIISA